MKVHRGEIVKKKLDELGIKINRLPDKLGYSRGHLYKFFENEDLPYKIIYDIGVIIKYDFLKEFPEMPVPQIEKNIDYISEEEFEYNVTPGDVYELKKSNLQLREKYYNLLEKYMHLL